MRLQSTLGELVPGRCHATNLCDYCARLAAVENAEVLALDALTNCAPLVWTVLTTRSTIASMAAYKVARMAVRRAVRRRWPEAETATLVEFQTGHGSNAAGARRPHWNDVWKGIAAADVDELHDVTSTAWCARVDALPRGQFAGPIAEMGGLMRYLALHFQKESQQPPKGWRSHRFCVTRGYLAKPMAEARQEARLALQLRRELWKLAQQGVEGTEALRIAQRTLYEREELGWSLVRLVEIPSAFDRDGSPSAWSPTPIAVTP